VEKEVNYNDKQFYNLRIVDAFVSISYVNRSVIENYRVFFVNCNVGIEQQIISINIS
jgi:hypothetical protein